MSSRQGPRLCFLFFSIFYFSYDVVARRDLTTTTTTTTGDETWLVAYKVIFLIAAVKSLASYVVLELDAMLERTRQLQYSALSTTSRGEALAQHREERWAERAFGHCERTLFNPQDRHNPDPVFWCTLTGFLILYNTAHLALVPLSCTSPLFFGTPAHVLYWGAVRASQMMLN